jgi:hypothetical protein
MATDELQERLERAARKLDYTDYPDEAAAVREAVDLLAEVARLDKQLLAARRVTLTDADGRPDDAALVRQLEDAAKEVDSSLLECAALRLKRATTEVARREEDIEGLRYDLRMEREAKCEVEYEIIPGGEVVEVPLRIRSLDRDSATATARYLIDCSKRRARLEADNLRLRAAAEAALRLCGTCRGRPDIVPDCSRCGPIRRALDAPVAGPAAGPEDSGEGCDA